MAKKNKGPSSYQQNKGSIKSTARSNKNQLAAERAKLKKALEGKLTTRICASPGCKDRSPIPMLDLVPVMTIPKRKMIFYHKLCAKDYI